MSATELALITVGATFLLAVPVLAIGVARLRRRAAAADARLHHLEEENEAGRQERARLDAAFGAADIGVLITDPAGEVQHANPAALRYLSGRVGQVVVESGVSETIAEVLRRGEALSHDLELYHPRRRVVRLEAVPLARTTGEPLGAAIFVADVTAERRLQAMRRDFVAAVGHELKTPLGAVSLLAETLVTQAHDPAAATDLAERLYGETARLARLIDDMLALAHAEEPVVAATPITVAGLVTEVVETARVEAARRGVQLVAEEGPTGLSVPGDRRQLRTMLANLVDNAVKYSDPQAGQGPARVWVRAREEGEWVELEVEDEGIGIPERHLERIFERFYRVDRARSRATGGTGLGLSIARHVALNHGGEIRAESRLGEGSVFRVRLPTRREP